MDAVFHFVSLLVHRRCRRRAHGTIEDDKTEARQVEQQTVSSIWSTPQTNNAHVASEVAAVGTVRKQEAQQWAAANCSTTIAIPFIRRVLTRKIVVISWQTQPLSSACHLFLILHDQAVIRKVVTDTCISMTSMITPIRMDSTTLTITTMNTTIIKTSTTS